MHPCSKLFSNRLKQSARFASALEAVPVAQPARQKRTHDLIVLLKVLVQQLHHEPDQATRLVGDIKVACEAFLVNPSSARSEGAEIIDTQALREEVERMVSAKSPLAMDIPKFPGNRVASAAEFFEEHYGKRYNRPGFETIFKVDLRAIDEALFYALRYACGGNDKMPIKSVRLRTEAICEGRFGDRERRLRTRQAIATREARALYSK